MTSDVNPQTIGVGFEYFTAGTQPSEKGVVPAQRNTLRTYNLHDSTGKVRSDIGGFEITINDFSQGLNHPEGPFSRHSNGYSWSDFITSRPNELVPPITVYGGSTPGTVSGDKVGVHHARVFDTLIVGCASGNNASLSKPTSATDPTLTAIAYSPSAAICSLTKFKISGAERLLVGRVGSAAQVLSDASGTVETTMHTTSASLWGCIVSGVNASSPGVDMLLLYAGTGLFRKSSDSTMTTTLGTADWTVPAGGFAVGAMKPAGRAEKAVWAFPKATNTAGALKSGAEKLMELWVTDMELATMDPLRLTHLPNGILGAVIWREGVVAFDDTTVVFWDGQTEYNLSIFEARTQPFHSSAFQTSNLLTSDYSPRARALCADGPNLYCIWQRIDNAGANSQFVYVDQYVYETGQWHNLIQGLALQSSGTTLDISLCGTGGAPFDYATRSAYFRADQYTEQFRPFYVARPGESYLWQNSQGSGSTTTNIPNYSTGRLLGPRWWLDGIKLNPKVITEVEFGGNLDLGGAGVWTLRVQVFGNQQDGTRETAYDKTFSQGKPMWDYVIKNTGHVNIFDLQVYLLATGGGVRTIPTLLPLTIRGVYSKDRRKLVTQAQLASVTG